MADAAVGTIIGATVNTGGLLSAGDIYGDGGSTSNTTVNNGGLEEVVSGAVAYDTTINNGGSQTVLNSGTASGTLINGGGTETVSSGGSDIGATDYGTLNVAGSASGTVISTFGVENVLSGGVVSGVQAGYYGNLNISSGGSAFNTNVLPDGTVTVGSGGSATNTSVGLYGRINVYGTTDSTTVSGSTQGNSDEWIYSGGVASNTQLIVDPTANNGGNEHVEAGGLAIGTQNDGAYLEVASGGVTSGSHEYYDGTVEGNTGNEEVFGGGKAYDSIIDTGGDLYLRGGIAYRTQVSSGGYVLVQAGTASGTTLSDGGSAYVSNGGSAADTTVLAGGLETVYSGGTIAGSNTDAGTVVLSAGAIFTGTETLAGSTGSPALFEFAPTTTGTQTGVISGFTTGSDGNQIEFGGYDSGATVTAGDGTVTISENGSSITVNIAGITAGEHLELNASGFLSVCFLEGTHILTETGERKVESLRAGDMVATVRDGRQVLQAVQWVGSRSIKITGPSVDDAYPVRIRAGAFAEGAPHRDLLITQEHCVFVNGKLIPARMLVNGRSIVIDHTISSFTYYHVELEQHGILLSEGLTTESYLDTGNRGNFANSDIPALRPDFAVNAGHKNWADHAAAPLAVDRATVEPVWQTLRARAEQMQFAQVSPCPATTQDALLHLRTNAGVEIWPVRTSGNRHFFLLPPNSHGVRLNSRTFRPADAIGPFVDDRRALGVLVGEVALWSGRKAKPVRQHLSNVALAGWHGFESDDRRWTTGNAELQVSTAGQITLLEVEVLAAGPYVLEAQDAGSLARCA